MKGLRVLELSEALNVDSSDLLAVCAILKIKATSRLSMPVSYTHLTLPTIYSV